MPSALERALRDQRTRLLERDERTLALLINQYQATIDRLTPLIELLQFQISQLEEPTPSQVLRLDRYVELQRQAVTEIQRLAQLAGDSVRSAQYDVARQAIEDAAQLAIVSAITPADQLAIRASFTRIGTTSVEEIFGALGDGSPLAKLLDNMPDDFSEALTRGLIDAVTTGTNPRAVADAINKALNQTTARTLTIARTETLRAYRASAVRTYEANSDIISGWIWTAAQNRRTCAACLAMDGTFHELDEKMASHPNCRCAPRPSLKNRRARTRRSGQEWLDQQTPDVQDEILGKQAGADYRAGKLNLSDFAQEDDSPVWGKSTRQASLAEARANAGRRVEAAEAKSIMEPSPRASVPQFKSTKDLAKWLQEGGVSVSGTPPLPAETLDVIAQSFRQEWDNQRNVVPDIRFINKKTSDIAKYHAGRGQGIAGSDSPYIEIYYKSKFWKDPRSEMKVLADKGWLTSGDPRSAIVHEFGHDSHFQRLTKVEGSFHETYLTPSGHEITQRGWNFWSDRGEDWERQDIASDRRSTAEKVSRYAATGPMEFVAETYSGLTSGVEYPESVMSLYLDMGGPEVKSSEDRKRKAS